MSFGKIGVSTWPAWLLVTAITISPCGAAAQLGSRSWSISTAAQQVRLGNYIDQQHEVAYPSGTGTIESRDYTRVRIEPQTGIGITATVLSTRTPWGAMASASYSRGDFMIHMDNSITVRDQPGLLPGYSGSMDTGPNHAASWQVGAGVVRQVRTGRQSVPAFITAGPLLTAVRLENLDTRVGILPGADGIIRYVQGPGRTRTYMSPGGSAGAGVDVRLGGRMALQLRATAGMLWVDGAAFHEVTTAPPAGHEQWRPLSTFGAGISYRLGVR